MSAQDAIETAWAGRHLSMIKQGRWEYVTRNTRKPAVGIVPLTDDRRVILIEQFRVPVNVRVFELPAGLAGDVPGEEHEPLLEAARRELLEETGYAAETWTQLTSGYTSPGLTDELAVLFLAEGLTKVSPGGGVDGEEISIHEVPFESAFQWLTVRGARMNLKLLAGLYAAEQHLTARNQPKY